VYSAALQCTYGIHTVLYCTMANSLITPGHTEPASSVNMRYWCHKYLERKNCIYIEVTYSAVASKNSFEGDRHSAGTACQFYCNILP
jgi:hypothetical protein